MTSAALCMMEDVANRVQIFHHFIVFLELSAHKVLESGPDIPERVDGLHGTALDQAKDFQVLSGDGFCGDDQHD